MRVFLAPVLVFCFSVLGLYGWIVLKFEKRLLEETWLQNATLSAGASVDVFHMFLRIPAKPVEHVVACSDTLPTC